MRIRRNRRKSEDEETSYWLSYSDMMAGLLLVFVLIISFTILQSKTQFEAKEEELAAQALVIYSQQEDLSSKESQLEDQQTQLEDQQSQLEEQQAELLSAQGLLTDQQSQLDEQQSALDAVKELLANQEALLAEKEALVGEQQEQLIAQQEKLDKIIGVKAEIIEELKNSFEGTSLSVSVDQKTGSIILDSSILFESDEYELSDQGRELLAEFIPIYVRTLLNSDFSGYVSEILIEGHTDTEGTYEHNLELSQQRALSVAQFCLNEDNGIFTSDEIEKLRSLITANGRSYSDPIYDENGDVDMAASRRVEFKFRLNDDEMVQEMVDILNETESQTQAQDQTQDQTQEN